MTVMKGLCKCGCGEAVALAQRTSSREGLRKGEPNHYILGHSTRKSGVDYIEEARGYVTPCWIWQRAVDQRGYGHVHTRVKTTGAHRVVYEQHRGPIPDGLVLDHLCRVPACVNPDHLEPVDTRTNILRGSAPNIVLSRANKCKRGHEYTPENTYYRRNGTRTCRACERRWKNEKYRMEKLKLKRAGAGA